MRGKQCSETSQTEAVKTVENIGVPMKQIVFDAGILLEKHRSLSVKNLAKKVMACPDRLLCDSKGEKKRKMEEKKEEICNCRHKHRDKAEERGLLNRLNRIEGQIRGIKAMVEDERYCVDIITQVSAVQAALNSFNKVLLEHHIKTCVVEDILSGNRDETVEELCKTLQKMMK